MFKSEFFTKHFFWPEKNRQTPPEFVRLLREVDLFADKHDRSKLIIHQLKAVVSEYLGIPFQPQYAMAIGPEQTSTHSLGLFDDIYFNSSVRQRCQMAIENATTSVLRKRYTLEGNQIENLISNLDQLLANIPTHSPLNYALLENIATSPQGWEKTSGLISTEVAQQFNLSPNPECWAGPKYFYVMPQSTVHQGWNSMYVIVQPVYIPESDLWTVLHNQHIVPSEKNNWQTHHDFLQLLNPDYQTPKKKSAAIQEATIMAQLIELPPEHQTTRAENVFLHLLKLPESTIQNQQQKRNLFEKITSRLQLHADYLLSVLDLDQKWEQEWTNSKKERLNQAITNTLATLIHQADGTIPATAFTHIQLQEWVRNYQDLFSQTNHRQNPWASQQNHLRSAITSAPWLKHGVASQIECLVFSFKGVTESLAKNSSLYQAMKNHALTKPQLEKLVGKKRADKWHQGECVACEKKDLVGECHVCFNCEHNLTNQKPQTLPKTSRKNPEKNNALKPVTPKNYLPKQSIGPTQVLAGAY